MADDIYGALAQFDAAANAPPPEPKPEVVEPGSPRAMAMQALQQFDGAAGKPEWSDERIPQADRINDFVQLKGMAAAQVGPLLNEHVDQFSKDLQARFPGADPEKYKAAFLTANGQGRNAIGLAQAKEKYKDFQEPGLMTLAREGVPVFTTGLNFAEKKAYAEAKERMAKGEYNPGDYAKVAHFEKLQENKQNESLGKSALRTAMNVGTFAGESFLGGTALKGLGVVPAIFGGKAGAAAAAGAAGFSEAAAPTLAARIVGKTAFTRIAAQTALMPSMWLPQSVDQAMQKGGNWSDISNLGPAYGMGMMQVGLLGAASKAGGSATAAKLIPGIAEGGVEGWATRLVTGTGVAMSGQAGIDVTNGIITSQLPVWGHKGYGTAVDLAQGKEGAAKAMALQLLTFALFNVGHAHNNPIGEARAAEAADGKAIMDLGSRFVSRLKAQGMSEDAAYGEAIKAHRLIMRQIQGHDIEGAKAGLSKMAQQYVDSLADQMQVDQLAAEQKAADIAHRNPKVGDFRGQFGSEEAQTEQSTSQKPAPAPETPQTPPTAPESAAAESTPEPSNAPQAKAGAPWTPELLDQFADTVRKSGENPMEAVKRLGLTPEQANAVLAKLQQPAPPAPLSAEGQADVEAAAKSLGYKNAKAMAKTDPKSLAAITEAVRAKAATEAAQSRKSAGSPEAPQVPRGTEGAERFTHPEMEANGHKMLADLKSSPEYAEVAKLVPEGSKPIGRPNNAFVFETPDGKIVRIGPQGERANVPEMLQPTSVEKVGKWQVETLPKAERVGDRDLFKQNYKKFVAALESQGYRASDLHPDNIGEVDGKPVIIDPGSVRKATPAELAKIAARQQAPKPVEPPPEPAKTQPEPSRADVEPPVRPHMNDVPQHIQDAIDAATDLTPREKAVLEGRAQGNSHQDLEAEFGVKRQRVEQIEKAAMAKLGIEHKSMADWLASKSPTGKTAHVDPEVIDQTARAATEKEGIDLTDEEIQRLPLNQRKFATQNDIKGDEDIQAAKGDDISRVTDPAELARLKQEHEEYLREFEKSFGDHQPPPLRRAGEPVLRGPTQAGQDQSAAAATEGTPAQGPAVGPETAPAARSEAASRELKFRTVAQEVSARGGIDPKTFASIHGLEVTREFMKEFPGLFRGKNLRGGKNKFEELVPNLVEDGVFSVPDGLKPTDAFLDVIKAKALDMSQNLDAKYQQESERYGQEQADLERQARTTGFSSAAVESSRALGHEIGEELADLEESERVAEADRAVQGTQGRGPASDAAGSVPEPEEGQGSGDEGAGRPGAGEFDFGANARPRAMGAAALGELTPGEGKVYRGETALANDRIDAERVKEGLNPIIRSARMENGEAWDQAMRRLQADPKAGENLIEEVIRKPRPLDVVEQAMLLREKIRLDNQYRKLQQDVIDAAAKDRPALEARLDGLGDQRYELALAVKRAGTELGRSLQFRRQLAAEDYSLAGMLRSKEVAKGKPLTTAEQAEVAILSRRIAELEAELAKRPDEKVESVLGRLKSRFTSELLQNRWSRKPLNEKLMDLYGALRRAFVLSSPVVVAKLNSAAATRMATSLPEEGVGYGVGKVFGRFGERTMMEHASAAGMAKQWATMFTRAPWTDAAEVFKTGRSALDVKYGEAQMPSRPILEFFGRLHGALKAPIKRAYYEAGLVKGAEYFIRQGEDPSNHSAEIGLAAYKSANRAIFMQDNFISDAFNKFVSRMEAPDPTTGKVNPWGKAGATLTRHFLPVVKVPTNIVGETLVHLTGLGTGTVGLSRAYIKGIESLPPEQADTIMRHLKKGSLGGAMLALGFFLPNNFGGYHQPGEKRREDDAEVGGAKIGSTTIPRYWLHNPLLEVAQVGATMRRVADSAKGDEGWGLFRAASGLIEEAPMAREAVDLSRLYGPQGDVRREAASQVKSAAVPAGVQWLGRNLDRPRDGTTIGPQTHRKVGGRGEGTGTTVKEEVQSGIPWWRQGLRPK